MVPNRVIIITYTDLFKLSGQFIKRKCWGSIQVSQSIIRSKDSHFFFFHFRENQQILGAYLTISDVKSEDFGEYICRISNPDTYIEMRTWLREVGKSVNDNI